MSDYVNANDQMAPAGQFHHDINLVYAAMMEELGDGRMDTLPLEDGGAKGKCCYQELPPDMHSILMHDKVSLDSAKAAWYNLDDSGKDLPKAEANGQLYRLREKMKQEAESKPKPLAALSIEDLKAFNASLTKAGQKPRGPSGGGRGGGSSSRGGHSSSSVRTPNQVIGQHLGAQQPSRGISAYRGSFRGRGSRTRTQIDAAISRLSKYTPQESTTSTSKQPAVSNNATAAASRASKWGLASPEAFLASTGFKTTPKTAPTSDVLRPAIATEDVSPAAAQIKDDTIPKSCQGLSSSRDAGPVPNASSRVPSPLEVACPVNTDRNVIFNHVVKVAKEGDTLIYGQGRLVEKKGQHFLTLEVEVSEKLIINEILTNKVLFCQAHPTSLDTVLRAKPSETWIVQFQMPYLASNAEKLVQDHKAQSHSTLGDPLTEQLVAISEDEPCPTASRGKNWSDMNSIANGPPLISVSDDGQQSPDKNNLPNQHIRDLAPLMVTDELIDMILKSIGKKDSFMNQVEMLVAADPEASKDPILEAKYKRVLTDGLQSSIWTDGKPIITKHSAASTAIITHHLGQGEGYAMQQFLNHVPEFTALLSKAVYDKAQLLELLDKTRLSHESKVSEEFTVSTQIQNDVVWEEFSAGFSKNADGNTRQGQISENIQVPAKVQGPPVTVPQASSAGTRFMYSAEEILALRGKASHIKNALPRPVTQSTTGRHASAPSMPSSTANAVPVARTGFPIVTGVQDQVKKFCHETNPAQQVQQQEMKDSGAVDALTEQFAQTFITESVSEEPKADCNKASEIALEKSIAECEMDRLRMSNGGLATSRFATSEISPSPQRTGPGIHTSLPTGSTSIFSHSEVLRAAAGNIRSHTSPNPECCTKSNTDTVNASSNDKSRLQKYSSGSDHDTTLENALLATLGIDPGKKSETPLGLQQDGKDQVSLNSSKPFFVAASSGGAEDSSQDKSKAVQPEQTESSKPIHTYLYDEKDKAKLQNATKEETVPLNGGLKASRWAKGGSEFNEFVPKPNRSSTVTASSHQTTGYLGQHVSAASIYSPSLQAIHSPVYQPVLIPDGKGGFVQVLGIVQGQLPVFSPSHANYQENVGYSGGASMSSPPFPGTLGTSSGNTKSGSSPSSGATSSTPRPALSPKLTNVQPTLQAILNQSLGSRGGNSQQ